MIFNQQIQLNISAETYPETFTPEEVLDSLSREIYTTTLEVAVA